MTVLNKLEIAFQYLDFIAKAIVLNYNNYNNNKQEKKTHFTIIIATSKKSIKVK